MEHQVGQTDRRGHRALSPGQLSTQFSFIGRSYTVQGYLWAVYAHHCYHFGQIDLLLRQRGYLPPEFVELPEQHRLIACSQFEGGSDMNGTAKANCGQTIEEAYLGLLGTVPAGIADRRKLAQATGREAAFDAVEALRAELIDRNPLDRRTQQLIHFAMLVARGERAAGRLHIAAALKAGATQADLQGVAETAAIVCGMPGYGLAVELIAMHADLDC